MRRLIAPMGWLWLALAPVLSAAQTLVPQNGTAASGLTGQVAIANGGTGQSSLAAAGLPVLIATSTPAGVGTVTFASIPNTYRDLQVRVRGAGAAAASFVNVGVQFNGDAGANYDFQENVTNNTTPGGSANVAQTSVAIGYLPAASGVANLGGWRRGDHLRLCRKHLVQGCPGPERGQIERIGLRLLRRHGVGKLAQQQRDHLGHRGVVVRRLRHRQHGQPVRHSVAEGTKTTRGRWRSGTLGEI